MAFITRIMLLAGATTIACGPTGDAATDTTTDATTETTTDATTVAATTTEPTTGTTTQAPTDATTQTPTESDATTADQPVEPPCAVKLVPGDHSAATCADGPCPIIGDVVLQCPQFYFGSPGVRVTATPDAMWIATASDADSMLYRITGDTGERRPLSVNFVRQTIHLATGPGGDLHVAAETAPPWETGNSVTYLSEAGGWIEQVLFKTMGGAPLSGFQVLPDGVPHIWHRSSGDDYELVPDGQGGWSSTPVALAPDNYGIPMFGRDANGRLLAADLRNPNDSSYSLDIAIDGVAQNFGKFQSPIGLPHFFLVPSAAPTPPVGPAFAALIESKDALEVVWPIDGEASAAVDIPVPMLVSACPANRLPDDNDMCGLPCVDQSSGYHDRTTTLARTPDGLAWAVVITTQEDATYEYKLECDRLGSCICNPKAITSAPTTALRLFRVTLDGSAPVEVLTLPFEGLALSTAFNEFGTNLLATHAQAFGSTLAIGLHVQQNGGPAVRALHIDLAPLLP